MISDRLAQLELQYDLLQQQLHGKELEKIMASPGDGVRIQQQIDLFIAPQLRECKQKYARALAEAPDFDNITDARAEIVVGEFVEELTQAKTQASDAQIQLLEQILAKLNEPGTAAAIKVKWLISPTPPFVAIGIEGELDPGNFLQRKCPTFTSWAKHAKKWLPPA
jgi:hypothetical protein